MITPMDIYAFIKVWPQFVTYLGTIYNDFKKLQIKTVEDANAKYIIELHTEIAKLKGAKTDAEIAAAIAALANGR